MVDSHDALAQMLDEYAEALDFVIIDTAPTPGMMMSIVLAATDWLLVPTLAEYLSIDGLVNTVQRAQAYRFRDIALLGIVPNLFQKATAVHQHNYAQLQAEGGRRGWMVWAPIAQRTAWRDASENGVLVHVQEPGKAAAKDAAMLAAQVMTAAVRHG